MTTVQVEVGIQQNLSQQICTNNFKTAKMLCYNKEQKCLTTLRKMITESNDELLVKNTWEFSDDFLLRYIRSRGYHLKSAFDRLQNHMHIRRRKNPEIFARLYPSCVYDALENGGARVLKSRDDKQRHVMLVKVADWNPDEVPVDDYLLALMLMGWEMLGFKETQLNGIVILIDGRGFGVKHARQGTPGNIQKYADLIVKASPFKCKGAHIIYTPLIFNMTLSLIKMFLPQKLGKRIHVHGNSTDSLHKFLSPDILPVSLGGHLTEDEAVDQDLLEGLYTNEKDDYYKGFVV